MQTARSSTAPRACPALWDVFCRVIDNYGDVGVAWRLCTQLTQRGAQVRLWIDDSKALGWMAPSGHPGVSVLPWSASQDTHLVARLPRADVWIEAFGCEIAPEFIASNPIPTSGKGEISAESRPLWPVWINLEYLSAEDWVQRCHTLASPVLQGPATGATKFFFYPGFSPATGGLLRENGLATQQQAFDRTAWLSSHGVAWQGSPVVSLFCYEPALLRDWLGLLARDGHTQLLVTQGRGAAAVEHCLRQNHDLNAALGTRVHFLPWLTQCAFDEMLWACDFNAVRGEDSLVRALWAGRPFVWQIYPQDDGVHHAKLDAFLHWLSPPAPWGEFHRAWNADGTRGSELSQNLESLWNQYPHWRIAAQQARARLLEQRDLCSQLLDFVIRKQ